MFPIRNLILVMHPIGSPILVMLPIASPISQHREIRNPILAMLPIGSPILAIIPILAMSSWNLRIDIFKKNAKMPDSDFLRSVPGEDPTLQLP